MCVCRSPLAQMEEERREHVNKMKKMEMEMEQVFEMKVKEKVQKLKDSEAEVSYASTRASTTPPLLSLQGWMLKGSVGGANPRHRGSFNLAWCHVPGSLFNTDRWARSLMFAAALCVPVASETPRADEEEPGSAAQRAGGEEARVRGGEGQLGDAAARGAAET